MTIVIRNGVNHADCELDNVHYVCECVCYVLSMSSNSYNLAIDCEDGSFDFLVAEPYLLRYAIVRDS